MPNLAIEDVRRTWRCRLRAQAISAIAVLVVLAPAHPARAAEDLNVAIAQGDVATARRLIGDKNTDLEKPDADGATPLINALLHERPEIVRLLIERGAAIDVSNSIESRLFARFVPSPRESRVEMTPLIIAAMVGDASIVEALLDRGASLTRTGEDGFTALQAAAVANHPAVVRVLMERGAPLDATNSVGQTALDMAQFLEHADVVRALDAASRDVAIPPIDVAGHYTIAVRTDLAPVGDAWTWGAIPIGIAVGDDGTVYWSEYRTNSIHRVAADGTHAETLAAGLDGPLGVAVDDARRQIFFTTDRHFPRSVGSLKIGSPPAALVKGTRLNRPFHIAVDEAAPALYWTESINGRVRRASIDGTGVTSFWDDGIKSENERTDAVTTSLTGIALDPQDGLIFWADVLRGEIIRARLDGSDRRTLLTAAEGVDVPMGIAVDTRARKLYWANPGNESIGRANLDGSQPETVAGSAEGVLEPYGVAIDEERRVLYATDIGRNVIWRHRLDDRATDRFVDLDSKPSPAAGDAPAAGCEAATLPARREFLRRWIKLIRTCLVKVAANKAVMRSPDDVQIPARTCLRLLSNTEPRMSLRNAVAAHCDGAPAAAVLERTYDEAATILATDLPRATEWLSDVRPFVAVQEASASTDGRRPILEAIDDLLTRLEKVERRPAPAAKWTLPASGQTTTYAAVTKSGGGKEVSVPDDGALRAGTPLTYVDNGDGTITDPTTRLTWERKCDRCGGLHDVSVPYAWQDQGTAVDVKSWLRSVNAEDGAGSAGHDDWRLPNLTELLTIVDFEKFNPAVAVAFQDGGCGLHCKSPRDKACNCTGMTTYWTADDNRGEFHKIAAVGFHLGWAWELTAEEQSLARAVRGPALPTDRFVDKGDGTVLDTATRLLWEKKCRRAGDFHDVDRRAFWSSDGTNETIWDWLELVNRENGHGYAGHDDWRIPNVKEMATLFDTRSDEPHIAPIFTKEACAGVEDARCSSTAAEFYWTSTTFADYPAQALAIGYGSLIIDGRLKTVPLAVRAVRGPAPETPPPTTE